MWKQCVKEGGGGGDVWRCYKELRKEVKARIWEEKKKACRDFEEKVESNFEENKKLFWGMTRRMVGKKRKERLPAVQNENGELIGDGVGQRKIFAKYFESLGKENEGRDVRFNEEFRKKVEKEVEEMIRVSPMLEGDVELDEMIGREEVERMIRKLKRGKAPGCDRIVSEMIKKGGEGMVEGLVVLFNAIWRNERVPEMWREGRIVPIFKKGDESRCENYRGITL